MKTGTTSSGSVSASARSEDACAFTEFKRLWLLAALPFVLASGFFLSLVLSDGVLLQFDADAGGTRDALLFLLLTSLTAVAAAIELDVRLIRIGGSEARGAREMLGFSSFVAFVLFLVWVAAAMDRSGSRKPGVEFLLCVLIVGTCAPLWWSAVRQVERAEHRWALLGGSVIATAAMELAFEASAEDAEERFFLYQSILVASALGIRLAVWGLKEFREPPGKFK